MLLRDLFGELPVNVTERIIEGITCECNSEIYWRELPVNVTGRIIWGITCECYWENY